MTFRKLWLSVGCVLLALALTPIKKVDGIDEGIRMILANPLILPLAVVLEELLFRLPLILPLALFGVGRVTLAAAFLLSFGFGQLHGDWHWLVQGPGGFLLCLVFIKCGGARGGTGYAKAFTSACAVHLLFNSILLAPTLIGHWLGLK
jgi:hypothetical protein